MKNQVQPVCSPKNKIWLQTDKLQRCRRLPLEQAIDFAVKLILFSFPNNMNPAQATNTFRTKCDNFPNIHPALPSPYILNDQGNPSTSPSTTTYESLLESLLFGKDSSILGSTSLRRAYSSVKNKKAQDRWSNEEEKLLVQLWAEQHGFAGNRGALKAWRDVLFRFCSQVRLQLSGQIFCYWSDLSRTNLNYYCPVVRLGPLLTLLLPFLSTSWLILKQLDPSPSRAMGLTVN